jgi:hypothetical protein
MYLDANDYFHRLDGASITSNNGPYSYHIHGARYRERDYWNHPAVKMFKNKLKARKLLGLDLESHPEEKTTLTPAFNDNSGSAGS